VITKILIAEYEEENRDELVECLTDDGFICVEASNGEEGFG
jgi:CheY-like chemotaxis protein